MSFLRYTDSSYDMILEYIILSECYIVWVHSYKDRIFFSPQISEVQYNGIKLNSYKVKLLIASENIDCSIEQKHKNNYHCPSWYADSIIEELMILLSLYFRCRFYPFSQTVYNHSSFNSDGSINPLYNDRTTHFKIHPFETISVIHPPIFSNGSEYFIDWWLGGFLEKFESLPGRFHQAFIFAWKHYHDALHFIGIDPSMMFTKLVSSIESFSSFTKVKKEEEASIRSWLKLIPDIPSNIKTEENEIIEAWKNARAKDRFSDFVEGYSAGYKMEDWRSAFIDAKTLLSNVYIARSKYLHQWVHMQVDFPYEKAFSEFIYPPKMHRSDGNKVLSSKEEQQPNGTERKPVIKSDASLILPYPHWFEWLVRHCLLVYLDRNTFK